MGTIRFLALGAGQDVGRSCVVVTLGGRTIMFDCGMHMGYNDARRFPDFTLLAPTGAPLTALLDCVIITHFHLDHCGALPYLTEMCGYAGPVLMTHPTKALCPILLEDYRRITVERKGESNFFTPAMIRASVARAVALQVGESCWLADGAVEVRAYYAGHVLGAAMFYVRVGSESVLYTGDYNMTPDRHLGAASAELLLRPDVLITESTYATTLRDSKRARERDFLRNIHQCVAAGGKVLIPVFALGRVQELCILVEAYWARMGLSVPIYFSAGMAESANEYYRIYVDWTNEKLRKDYPVRNLFDFEHVKPFERHFADHPGPMVLFSSPGMLHSGTSLEIFKRWCGDERNLLIIPGFCVSGTVGAKILAGQRHFEVEEGNAASMVNVRMQVRNMSFSAHADARGIMAMIRTTRPRNVVLVHGEPAKMTVLKAQIVRELGVPCFDPPNGMVLHMESAWRVPVRLARELVDDARSELERCAGLLSGDDHEGLGRLAARRAGPIEACGVLEWTRRAAQEGAYPAMGSISPGATVRMRVSLAQPGTAITEAAVRVLRDALVPYDLSGDGGATLLAAQSVRVHTAPDASFIEWRGADGHLAERIIHALQEQA